MKRYAQGTRVPASRTVAEIQRTLLQYGASEFGYFESGQRAVVGFVMEGLRFEIGIGFPEPATSAKTAAGQRRSAGAAQAHHQAEIRRRWRSLAAVIKALLVAVRDGIMDIREAFMPYVVMSDGSTVADHLLPLIDEAAKAGTLPSSMRIKRDVPLLGVDPESPGS